MINITSGILDVLLIAVAKGIVTVSDYEKVLIPAIQSRQKVHGKICLLLELDNGFSEFVAESIWADAKRSSGRGAAFEAIAVVTDEKWIIAAAKSFLYYLEYPVKAFKKDKLEEAKEWVTNRNAANRVGRLPRIVHGWYSETATRTVNSSIPSADFSALSKTPLIQLTLSE